jgi:hypothetical protein
MPIVDELKSHLLLKLIQSAADNTPAELALEVAEVIWPVELL